MENASIGAERLKSLGFKNIQVDLGWEKNYLPSSYDENEAVRAIFDNRPAMVPPGANGSLVIPMIPGENPLHWECFEQR